MRDLELPDKSSSEAREGPARGRHGWMGDAFPSYSARVPWLMSTMAEPVPAKHDICGEQKHEPACTTQMSLSVTRRRAEKVAVAGAIFDVLGTPRGMCRRVLVDF